MYTIEARFPDAGYMTWEVKNRTDNGTVAIDMYEVFIATHHPDVQVRIMHGDTDVTDLLLARY